MYLTKTALHVAVGYAMLMSFSAHAANTGLIPCTSTAECSAEAAKIRL